jgi:hypothetical protein
MKKAALLIALLSGSFVKGQAQRPSGFDNSTREVISGTDIRLLPASKIRIEPELPPTEAPKITLDFSTPNYTWDTKKYILKLEPDIIKERSEDSVYLSNYMRIGGGNNGHLLGELFLSNRPNNQWAYNLSALHFQGNTSLNGQKVAQTRLNMNSSRYFENASLNAGIFYHRDLHTYFNLLDSSLKENDSTQVGTLAKNGKVSQNYGVHIDYLFLEKRNLPQIKWFNTGQIFQTNAGHEEMEFNSTLNFLTRNKKFALMGDLSFTYIDYQTGVATNSNFRAKQIFVDFNPRVHINHAPSKLDALIGINLTYNQHSTTPDAALKINPFVHVEKGLDQLGVKFYGGIDGGLRKNSFRRIHETMPFYGVNDTIINTYDQINGFLGIKGKITSNADYFIDFGGNSIADMLMFVHLRDSNDILKEDAGLRPLRAIYRDLSSLYFRVGAAYSISEQLSVNTHLKMINYGTDDEYFHLPSMEYQLKLSYKPIEELKIEIGAEGVNRRFDQTLINNVIDRIDVKGYTDVFARIDYRFIGKGRIWLQGSNLLNQKYMMWNGYPVWGLTVMGGISLGLF